MTGTLDLNFFISKECIGKGKRILEGD